MPRFLGFLDRFRRLVAPPGRPSEAVGVPSSGDDLVVELGPLLEQLDAIGAETGRIVDEAREEAGRRRERGLLESEAIVQEARASADVERARAAARVRAGVDGGARQALATDAELARLAEAREERLAGLVAEVLECVRRSGR